MASTIVRGGNEQWDIFVMDVNGRGLFRLTGDEGNERFPDFKPVPEFNAKIQYPRSNK